MCIRDRSTYAADALTESGKVIQLPSTHLLGTNFSKPFNVKFIDKDGKEKFGYITCYGPAISRIYGAMIAILGDDKGLVLPFDLAPVQIVIVPIIFKGKDKKVLEATKMVYNKLKNKFSVKVDERDIAAGEKFNEWELKGVPLRLEIGPKDVDNEQVIAVNRFTKQKQAVKLSSLEKFVKEYSQTFTAKLREKKLIEFSKLIVKTKTVEEIKKAIDNKMVAACGICSIGMDGYKCAEIIEKSSNGLVRGKKVDKENIKFDKCVVCGKPAKETVYVAKSY